MCASAIVILHIREKYVAQMSLAKDDDMIEAFPSYRTPNVDAFSERIPFILRSQSLCDKRAGRGSRIFRVVIAL
jgi:hypothetical protein